jgi:alanine racemase
MAGDTEMIRDLDLTPMLNSLEQITRHLEALPGHPFGVQLDTGMNRLGVEMLEWQAVAPILIAPARLADEPPGLRRRARPSAERPQLELSTP